MPSKTYPCREKTCPVLLPSPGRCPTHRRTYDNRVVLSHPWNPRGSYGSAWAKLSKQVLKEEPFCRCGCGRPSQVVDHIIARRFGGSEDRANLQAMTNSCHGAKTEQELAAWRRGKRSARVENGKVIYL